MSKFILPSYLIYNSSSTDILSSATGPAGATGVTGPTGATGAIGPVGPTGSGGSGTFVNYQFPEDDYPPPSSSAGAATVLTENAKTIFVISGGTPDPNYYFSFQGNGNASTELFVYNGSSTSINVNITGPINHPKTVTVSNGPTNNSCHINIVRQGTRVLPYSTLSNMANP